MGQSDSCVNDTKCNSILSRAPRMYVGERVDPLLLDLNSFPARASTRYARINIQVPWPTTQHVFFWHVPNEAFFCFFPSNVNSCYPMSRSLACPCSSASVKRNYSSLMETPASRVLVYRDTIQSPSKMVRKRRCTVTSIADCRSVRSLLCIIRVR